MQVLNGIVLFIVGLLLFFNLKIFSVMKMIDELVVLLFVCVMFGKNVCKKVKGGENIFLLFFDDDGLIGNEDIIDG